MGRVNHKPLSFWDSDGKRYRVPAGLKVVRYFAGYAPKIVRDKWGEPVFRGDR